jgi:hypothetical protein
VVVLGQLCRHRQRDVAGPGQRVLPRWLGDRRQRAVTEAVRAARPARSSLGAGQPYPIRK